MSKEEQLDCCLVGRWGEDLILESELILSRKWEEHLWNLKR